MISQGMIRSPMEPAAINEAGLKPFLDILRDRARREPGAALSLPGIFYASPQFFAHEVNALLAHEWHCLGRADEVPEPGDYFTADLLGEPLLVVRGDDGVLRILSNICRHRGMPLAEGRGRAEKFVCSYHAWSYGRDGRLRNAPRMRGTALDAANCRLPEFRSEIWQGFVYVNLDDDAAPLAPRLTGLGKVLAPYHTGEMRIVHVAEEAWQTNWKCLVENFMEGYHLSVVHPETLHDYTPTGLSRKFDGGAGHTGYCANYPKTIPPQGKGHDELSEEERHRSTLFCVYPAQVVSQAASLLVSLSLQPLAVDRVRVRWTLSVWSDELGDDEIARRIGLWERVNTEDREKLERLQQVLGARHADAGPLAPPDLEGTTHDFQRYLASMLLPPDEPSGA